MNYTATNIKTDNTIFFKTKIREVDFTVKPTAINFMFNEKLMLSYISIDMPSPVDMEKNNFTYKDTRFVYAVDENDFFVEKLINSNSVQENMTEVEFLIFSYILGKCINIDKVCKKHACVISSLPFAYEKYLTEMRFNELFAKLKDLDKRIQSRRHLRLIKSDTSIINQKDSDTARIFVKKGPETFELSMTRSIYRGDKQNGTLLH